MDVCVSRSEERDATKIRARLSYVQVLMPLVQKKERGGQDAASVLGSQLLGRNAQVLTHTSIDRATRAEREMKSLISYYTVTFE